MIDEDLFEAVCNYRVLKIFINGKYEFKYFESKELARENVILDKYCEIQFIAEREKNGKFKTIKFRRKRGIIEDWDYRLDDDGSHQEPFGSMLERSMAQRARKMERLAWIRSKPTKL